MEKGPICKDEAAMRTKDCRRFNPNPKGSLKQARRRRISGPDYVLSIYPFLASFSPPVAMLAVFCLERTRPCILLAALRIHDKGHQKTAEVGEMPETRSTSVATRVHQPIRINTTQRRRSISSCRSQSISALNEKVGKGDGERRAACEGGCKDARGRDGRAR